MEPISAIDSARIETLEGSYQSPQVLKRILHRHLHCDCCRVRYDQLGPFEYPEVTTDDTYRLTTINNRLKIVIRSFKIYDPDLRLRHLLGERRFETERYENLEEYLRSVYDDDMADLISDYACNTSVYTLNCKNCIKLTDDDFFKMMQMQFAIEEHIEAYNDLHCPF